MRSREAAEEELSQYAHGPLTLDELDEKYPNRPHNHSKTFPFRDLFLTLFNPLNENKKKPTGRAIARKKLGPVGSSLTPNEVRRKIVERFISRWRRDVGNDIYPAFRLIIPEKDRDRAMYGLKEKAIGKLLVRILRIDKDSEDGFNLLNWKLPGHTTHSVMAGDFAGRCFEVISKRPILTKPGNMSIAEVNEKLDLLSAASKEEEQLPIFREFYKRMNAEELMWLIRIILRQMKVGATERTIFAIWHPDAENLFNVSSSLRRVCWELYDPAIRLDGDERGINLMQCFQPQLAAFQMHSFEKMVARMKPTEDDDEFWIEEKLDGERMQLHMIEDDAVPGGKRFSFWSRKAKDYTYLYGTGILDENSALTRHLKDAFSDGVRNIILDGEMITWDMEQDAMVPFGTLKTAALAQQQNPFSSGQRPLYRVFDCLYLNDQPLTNYTLRDRRRALEASINSVNRRLEIHSYTKARSAADIEPLLRQVVAEASEGLVIKSPRSMYKLNQRNDDWIKVKPEYMTEFGEDLDCVVIGGYYGSGHRGGRLSSFLCGLRVDQNQIDQGANPMKCFSFFKVGGGMTAADYAAIRHHTDDKWEKWDAKRPPTEYIELGGGERQYERPDVWIKPCHSVVLSVKAASVGPTDQFRMGLTLRFPRYKKLRTDKGWKDALSIQGFMDLKNNAEKDRADKKFKVDDGRRQRLKRAKKKPLTVVGADDVVRTPYAGPHTKVFEGLTFFIMSECLKPKTTKAELERIVKENGGKLVQTHAAAAKVLCVADRRLVSVASLVKKGSCTIVRPAWVLECVKQAETDIGRPSLLLPYEERHIYHVSADDPVQIDGNVDEHGDSYARDVGMDELREILKSMPDNEYKGTLDAQDLLGNEDDDDQLRGWLFRGLKVYVDTAGTEAGTELSLAATTVAFAGGAVARSVDNAEVTHVVVEERERARELRARIAGRARVPRVVRVGWVGESWREGTLLDEEGFAVV
ncbi:uncharacterized protein K452DRAFT_299493 [Aplosporella prunicola CBS 121167]|uniref:DNA ligase n=1 Tax=Aplosporella prunicola CBS 121167 TaxID=1176127 RepID=A0A6A6BB17_9PEZI|nr:uncharacterized protein K452DRAFT_299493 [Aplosporella prunicola CBS 121167]KAF2140788.1 hypothetical protein K452DRAFT_299493 [Aplosporella prunicola CBS 121167]